EHEDASQFAERQVVDRVRSSDDDHERGRGHVLRARLDAGEQRRRQEQGNQGGGGGGHRAQNTNTSCTCTALNGSTPCSRRRSYWALRPTHSAGSTRTPSRCACEDPVLPM